MLIEDMKNGFFLQRDGKWDRVSRCKYWVRVVSKWESVNSKAQSAWNTFNVLE